MKPEENYKDDLQYLSQQGFEKVPVHDSELEDLRQKIKRKGRGFSSLYSGLGLLVTGVLIGALLFFLLSKNKDAAQAPSQKNVVNAKLPAEREKVIELEPVIVKNENFINPVSQNKALNQKKEIPGSSLADSVDIIIPKPIDLSLLDAKPVKEEKLKFMINSPVFYLNDMKVTNYTTLYFKKNHFIPFSGTSAAYSIAKENAEPVSHLKESADYFLHEEIAQAMLYFKKGKYDQAINSLNLVSTYNPEDLNCDFYLAMSFYYKKNYSKAMDLFNTCINNANNAFLEEASYYKAVALYESGDLDKAKALFKKIVEENEFYAEKAATYLK